MPPVPPQQSNQDGHMGPLWITVGIFFVALVVWYSARVYINEGILWLKYWELRLISFFTPAVHSDLLWIKQANPRDITGDQLLYISDVVGHYFIIPVVVVMVYFAWVLYRKSIGLRFRHAYSTNSLLKLELSNWPQVSPVANLDLVKEDIEKGPWSMASTPMQFAKKNNLIKVSGYVREEMQLKKAAKPEVSLLRPKAAQFFAQQLGKPWHGFGGLGIHARALCAIFVARVDGNIAGATHLLDQIAASSCNGKFNFSGADALLKKHMNNKIVQKTVHEHAYVLTVLASLLELTRTIGVMPTASFLWLKPIDRHLWYMLNSVGRQTPFVEVAGPFAHWLTEKELGHKVITPMLDQAVDALDEALKSVVYKPDEEDD